jgi:hypothetical protein
MFLTLLSFHTRVPEDSPSKHLTIRTSHASLQRHRTPAQERYKAVQKRCLALRERLKKAILVLQCSRQGGRQYILEELAIWQTLKHAR